MFFNRASCEVGPAVEAPKLVLPDGAACDVEAALVVAVEVGAAEVVVAVAAPEEAPPNRLEAAGAEVAVAADAGAVVVTAGGWPKDVVTPGCDVGAELAGLWRPEKRELACAAPVVAADVVGVEDEPPAGAKSEGPPVAVEAAVDGSEDLGAPNIEVAAGADDPGAA